MAPYQVLLVDRSNYTFAIEQIEGEDDAAAVSEARKIRVPSFGAGFEVWQGERFVCAGICRAIADRESWVPGESALAGAPTIGG